MSLPGGRARSSRLRLGNAVELTALALGLSVVAGVLAYLGLVADFLVEEERESVASLVFGIWGLGQTLPAICAVTVVLCSAVVIGRRRLPRVAMVAVVWCALVVGLMTAATAIWVLTTQLGNTTATNLALASALVLFAAATLVLAAAGRAVLTTAGRPGAERRPRVRLLDLGVILLALAGAAQVVHQVIGLHQSRALLCASQGADDLSVIHSTSCDGWWSLILDRVSVGAAVPVLVAGLIAMLVVVDRGTAPSPGRRRLAAWGAIVLAAVSAALAIEDGASTGWAWRLGETTFMQLATLAAVCLLVLPAIRPSRPDKGSRSLLQAGAFTLIGAAALGVGAAAADFFLRADGDVGFGLPLSLSTDLLFLVVIAGVVLILVRPTGRSGPQRSRVAAGVTGAAVAFVWGLNALAALSDATAVGDVVKNAAVASAVFAVGAILLCAGIVASEATRRSGDFGSTLSDSEPIVAPG